MISTYTLGLRLTDAERMALYRAAAAQERSAAWLMRRIVIDWLGREGWLPEAPAPRPEPEKA